MACAIPANEDEHPEIVLRPIFLKDAKQNLSLSSTPGNVHTHSVKSAAVRIEQPHSAGRLEGLANQLEGLRECADDLIAFDKNSVVVCYPAKERFVKRL